MAAVAPQKQQCKFAREYPAGSSVGAATTPSRWDVVCNVFFWKVHRKFAAGESAKNETMNFFFFKKNIFFAFRIKKNCIFALLF